MVYTYTKVVVLAFILFHLSANLEAYRIFNKPSYMVAEGWYNNDAIYPPIIGEVGDDTQISDLIYKRYKLLVFDLVYSRVLNGRFYLLKQISIINILRIFFYYLLGVSRVMVITILTIIKVRSENTRNGLLFKLFLHPMDNRKLIKINNKWVANGKHDGIPNIFKMMNTRLRGIGGVDSTSAKIAWEIHDRVGVITSTKYKLAIFINKNEKQIPHKAYPEAATGDNVGLETDFHKSTHNTDYNREVIIRKYIDKKESTLLLVKATDLKQISKEKEVSVLKQILGAHKYGYNEKIISEKFKEEIEQINEIESLIRSLAIKTGTEGEGVDIYKTIQYINYMHEGGIEQ
jgi:hypothetical protein